MAERSPDPREMRRQIQGMDEGAGAGPDGPETVEPVHGAGRERAIAWDDVQVDGWRHRNADGDAHLDAAGATGIATWKVLGLIARPWAALRNRLGRG